MQITPTTINVASNAILTTEYVIGNIITRTAANKHTANNTIAEINVALLPLILIDIFPYLICLLFLAIINTIKAKICKPNDIGYDA